jgi:hypothetical protein
MVLPRQARDKHRRNSTKVAFSYRERQSDQTRIERKRVAAS